MDWNELPDLPDLSSAASQPDPLLSRRLQQLVSSLPPVARTILVLRYQEDMSPDEISDTLDMPVRAVQEPLATHTAAVARKARTRA